jgi:hypothetical protein
MNKHNLFRRETERVFRHEADPKSEPEDDLLEKLRENEPEDEDVNLFDHQRGYDE